MTFAPRRGRRALLGGLAAAVLMTSAVGPSRLAGAVTGAPTAQPAGFLPAPIPVRVTAPTLRILGLSTLLEDQSIALAGGARSPGGRSAQGGTVLLGFARIDLDRVSISQSRAGEFALAITNAGSGDSAAVIGGVGGSVELWGVLTSLEVCLPASTLRELATRNIGDAVARRIVTELLSGRDSANPPCTPVRPLIPALAALLRQGGKVPELLRGRGLDITVYAMRANAGAGALSLSLPLGRLLVTSK